MVIAGGFDFILSLVCLGMFLRAEAQRCCVYDNQFIDNESLTCDYQSCDPNPSCCPQFGNRLCGGVGNLEPITAMIVLRLFRFVVGKRLWSLRTRFNATTGFSNHADRRNQYAIKTSGCSTRRKALTHGHDYSHHCKGTIDELWAMAVAKFPEIAATEGIFSGRLLEAMLGIKACPVTHNACSMQDGEQSIPLGRLNVLPSLAIRPSALDKKQTKNDSLGVLSLNEPKNHFLHPTAPLLHELRTTQYKWLPLLDDWDMVDVVITKYEIVWLAPKGKDGICDLDECNARENNGEDEKITVFKNGGQGVCLHDIAMNRDVVGRLTIGDIEQIKVQRYPPNMKVQPFSQKEDVECQSVRDSFSKSDELSPSDRFENVMEDVLTLKSPQGTLCLRFFADLVNEEERSPQQRTTNVYSLSRKGVALTWCQSISDLCGSEQLKQRLHHSRNSGDGKLFDFVEEGETKKVGSSFKMFRST